MREQSWDPWTTAYFPQPLSVLLVAEAQNGTRQDGHMGAVVAAEQRFSQPTSLL